MNFLKRNSMYLAWLVALAAILGSLFFQYVMHFAPCVLCWYQRVALYPLAVLIPIGIIRKDKQLPIYIIPLMIIGGAVSLYHNLLYYNFIPETLAPCVQGVSCTTKFINYFGFVSIPLLSLTAFIIIIILMVLALKGTNRDERS